MKSFNTVRAMLKRFTRRPLTMKSSETMLPDMSRADTMSTPLAFTSVWLFMSRGWASATMNMARMSQRQTSRKPPGRDREMLCMPRTSCTEE